ncbi:MAG: hypothetical protein AABX03_03415 [Nanoarchaeota archaeon]
MGKYWKGFKENKMNKGTKEGTEEEINFVKKLNRNKDSTYWKILKFSLNKKNLFAVHIVSHKFGKINGSYIKPKADLFIGYCKEPIRESYLKEQDYYLSEKDLEKINLAPVNHTGISVKRSDSNKYQILKMNPSTFKKIFGNFELGAGASIYCTKIEELSKNASVLNGWNTNWEKFEGYFSNIRRITLLKNESISSKERLIIAREVKTYSNYLIGKTINENKNVSNFVFMGIGNFEEPFTATWFFESNKLRKASIVPFVITTGSGRSHGDFTVVVKPTRSI